jgi:hypothetical protein
MKKPFDITDRLFKKLEEGNHENKIGRYSCSKIWGMINGYLKPEDYIKGEEFSVESAVRMQQGTYKHKFLESLFPDHQTEIKKEMDCRTVMGDVEFTLVGIADILDLEGKNVCDFKTSAQIKPKAKPWDEFQVRMYCTIFERQKGLIVQPRYNKDKMWLEIIGTVERDDDWFNEQISKLVKYHEKLLKVVNK